METPKNWPPSQRVPVEEQSRIIAKVDALIERQKKALEKSKELRMVLLLGWKYWHDHQQLMVLLKTEKPHQLAQRAHFAWKRIKKWRDGNHHENQR